MKKLTDFITEKYSKFQLQEVTVKYGTDPADLVFEQPESYLEDNMLIYMQDTIADNSFVGPKFIEEFFGVNTSRLDDVYFEYSGYDETQDSINVKFDKHYDEKNVDSDALHRVKYKNVYMVVKFSKFELKSDDNDDTTEVLQKIFERPLSDEYEWPIKFTLEYDNIEYT